MRLAKALDVCIHVMHVNMSGCFVYVHTWLAIWMNKREGMDACNSYDARHHEWMFCVYTYLAVYLGWMHVYI